MDNTFKERGFLPTADPARSFAAGSEFSILDDLGRDLPSMLHDKGFRDYAQTINIPPWPTTKLSADHLAEMRLYYVRVGFLASAYIHQVGQDPVKLLPKNIAKPLCEISQLLNRPPILSYDGYALYNWKRFNPACGIVLGNIDTIQNFVHMYDEHWFILVHIEIEQIAAQILHGIDQATAGLNAKDPIKLNDALTKIASAAWDQWRVLKRIPEKMDPALYYKTFRPYISFFENVTYEGIDLKPINYRGETGAQSSILPLLVSFLKVPHQPSILTNHLADMRNYMPVEHRALLKEVEALPALRDQADKTIFNDILEAMAAFREVHLSWAEQYINKWVKDPRGTGGTPYMQWLKQLIDETRAHKIT